MITGRWSASLRSHPIESSVWCSFRVFLGRSTSGYGLKRPSTASGVVFISIICTERILYGSLKGNEAINGMSSLCRTCNQNCPIMMVTLMSRICRCCSPAGYVLRISLAICFLFCCFSFFLSYRLWHMVYGVGVICTSLRVPCSYCIDL